MPPISAAINVAKSLPMIESVGKKIVPPVSRAFQVARDTGFADKLRGISQIGIG